MTFMKRNYKILLLVAALSVAFWSFIPKAKNDPEKDKVLLELLAFVIERGHYDPAAIDDNFSKGIYKDYIQALDPSKRFFLQSDVDEFAKYEMDIDDQIRNKDLAFFELTYGRLMQRIKESKNYYKDVLDKPIDYNIEEQTNTDYEKMPYAKNTAELRERWRKQIKLSALSSLTDKIELQEKGKTADKTDEAAKVKKDDVKIEKKSYEQLEKETRESSLKSLNEYFGFIDDLNREDWFSVFVNAIDSIFDPNKSFFAPE
jgi:carboxyl-terminal processing protease